MTKQTEIYNTLEEAKLAKARNRVIHAGDEPLHTNKRIDGKWEVIWALPNDRDHSINFVDPQQTEKDRLRVLQQKIRDDSITDRELVEYERLKLELGR